MVMFLHNTLRVVVLQHIHFLQLLRKCVSPGLKVNSCVYLCALEGQFWCHK